MAASDSWCSPHAVQDGLAELFHGELWCDPCSNPFSIIQSKKAYTIGGLHLPWGTGKKNQDTAYVNNPYSKTKPWITKGHVDLETERLRELVYLVMLVPSTGWWRAACAFPRMNPRIIATTRLSFIEPGAKLKLTKKGKPKRPDSARFETALIYYGRRAKAFDKAFAHITSWSTWGRSVAA